VRTLAVGVVDLAADLGADFDADDAVLAYARARILLAARAARLAAPIDGPFLRIRDHERFAADCRRSRAQGFGGRIVIHPGQLAAAHEEYGAPPVALLQRAARIVDAFERAEREGVASIVVDGEFVDYPAYHQATGYLAQAAGRTGDAVR
jgi:citrate lyase subunit beta/citryl-CoA lyase